MADDIGAPAELRFPVRVTEDDHWHAGRHAVFPRHKEAAERGAHVKQVEIARADTGDRKFARGLTVADRHLHRREAGDDRKATRHSPNVEEATHRGVGVRVRLVKPRSLRVQPMHGCGVTQVFGRPKQQTVNNAEHRRIRADAESECQHHPGGEAGTCAQTADRVPQILQEGFDEHGPAHVAALFLDLLQTAEGEPRSPACRGRRHAGSFIRFGFTVEVKAQLVVQLALQCAAPEDCAHAVRRIAPQLTPHVPAPPRRSCRSAHVEHQSDGRR